MTNQQSTTTLIKMDVWYAPGTNIHFGQCGSQACEYDGVYICTEHPIHRNIYLSLTLRSNNKNVFF